MYHEMDLHHEPGKQTFRQYAGYDTEEMRQRAIAHGCENDAEIEHWLDVNFSNDRSGRLIDYQYLRRKGRKRLGENERL